MTDRTDCRLLIADTDSSNELFSDGEIDTFLTLGVSVYGAAALALRSRISDLSRTFETRIGGGAATVAISTKDAALRLEVLADKYEMLDRDNFAAEIVSWADPDLDEVKTLNRDYRYDREATDTEFGG